MFSLYQNFIINFFYFQTEKNLNYIIYYLFEKYFYGTKERLGEKRSRIS